MRSPPRLSIIPKVGGWFGPLQSELEFVHDTNTIKIQAGKFCLLDYAKILNYFNIYMMALGINLIINVSQKSI